MPVHLVATVIAPDQPGIVEHLSQTIADAGASWLGSRMTRLAEEFAGIVEISAPEATAGSLAAALRALDAQGMRVQVKTSATPTTNGGKTHLLNLELTGDDRPGIVREIAHALARRGVNVHELETRVESAAMSGDPLFRANARLEVPGEIAAEDLAEELEKIAHDVMVDLTGA
jgi:glycine cleavage system regulatory protein